MARDGEIILGRASLTTAGRIAYITSTATLGQTDLYWASDLLRFGGTTSSFPAIKRSTTELQARLADDTAYTDFRAAVFQVNTNGGLMYSAGDSAIRLVSNSGGGILLETAGTDPINLATNNTTFWQISSAGLLAPQNSGATDFGSAGSTNPNKEGTSLPGSCAVGQTYFKTDATAGQNTYGCTATDTWTLQGDGSGGGSPGGSGSEVQYRAGASTFGAVTGSSVSGRKITLAPDGTDPALNIGAVAGDPSSLSNGDIWYNSSTNKFRCRQNGASADCIAAGSLSTDSVAQDELDDNADTSSGNEIVFTNGSVDFIYKGLVGGASGGITTDLTTDPATVDIVTAVIPRYAAANVWTGNNDFGGATGLEIPNGTAPTTDTLGDLALDSNGDGSTIQTDVLQWGDGTNTYRTCGFVNYPSADNDVLVYDSATNSCKWEAQAGGSGDPQVYFMPKDAMFPATNGAYLQCRESSAGAPRPQWCEILYTTGDLATWDFVVPSTYSGTITAHVQYKMVSATANNTEWSSRLSCVTPGDSTDVDADSFATADASADDTVPGTAGYLAEHTWTLSNTDGIAAGDLCVIQLERSTPTGTDATGDAETRSFFLSW
jgi:hypothetical protein